MSNRVVVLSGRQIERICDWKLAFEASADAFLRYSTADVQSPNRMRLQLGDGRRFALMPSVDPGRGALGVKLVGYYPDNPAHGLARVTGVYALFDPQTGTIGALMEGGTLTNLRTAAGAVVAARALARPGWRRLGVIGSGGLACASARAFVADGPPESVTVHSRTPANAARLVDTLRSELSAKGLPTVVRVADSVDALVRDSDVIVCGTDTKVPVFDGRALRCGQLVISLGANTPATRELDSETMVAGRVFVDSRSAVLSECGEIAIARAEGRLGDEPELTELGAVLAGTRPGRLNDDETLVFLSTGLALQDSLTAIGLMRRALDGGVGTTADLLEA